MMVISPNCELDFDAYYELRWRVLRQPLGLPRGSEKDCLEEQSIHVMVIDERRAALGVGRVHFTDPDHAQVRFMAVDERHRRRGIGSLVLAELERRTAEKGIRSILLNARQSAVPFYEKQGYELVEWVPMPFLTVPHFKMIKLLEQPAPEPD